MVIENLGYSAFTFGRSLNFFAGHINNELKIYLRLLKSFILYSFLYSCIPQAQRSILNTLGFE